MTNRKLTYIAENEVLQIELPSKICKDWMPGKLCVWHNFSIFCQAEPCQRRENRDYISGYGYSGMQGSTRAQGTTGVQGTTGILGWTGMQG